MILFPNVFLQADACAFLASCFARILLSCKSGMQYQGACVSGFVPVLSANQIVLGVPFLRAWHTQYSYDPASQVARIGLATPTAVPSPSSTAVQTSSAAFAGRRLRSQASTEPQEPESQTQVFEASIPSAKDRGIQ